MSNIIKTVAGIAEYAKSKKIAHLHTDCKNITNSLISINQKELVNFASCSYLGLEFHPDLKKSAIGAINNFGTQFSSSRAYLSLGLYEELTFLLDQIFEGHTVVTPTTTLGHISTIPVIVGPKDLIIMDHQVHNSVQMAVQIAKANRTEVKIIRHNNLESLEQLIQNSRQKYDRIWYMADGIYSMYGDKAPINELVGLMDKYENFYTYIDDAHAMSCFGEKGQGFVLNETKITEKMIVGTSLNKAFATGGGAIICGNPEWSDLIRKCGGPMITSGPMQPSSLGAAIASAKLHLNGGIKKLQEKLQDNITYTDILLRKYGLPNLSEKDSPIFFVGCSLPAVAYNIIEKMVNDGHYLNLGIFPAVPIKNTGVRFTLTAMHSTEEIEKMVADLYKNFNHALIEEQFDINKIFKAFKLERPEEQFFNQKVNPIFNNSGLEVITLNKLSETHRNLWDKNLGKTSTFNSNNLIALQKMHKGQSKNEDNWTMKFLFVMDKNEEIILSTFYTSCIVKEDMLDNAELSVELEKLRLTDPLYMTSQTVMLGCPITEGKHLFLNERSDKKNLAIQLMIKELEAFQESTGSNSIMLRDMPNNDADLDFFMVDNSFFKVDLPTSHTIFIESKTEEEFIQSLNKRKRKHYRDNIVTTSDKIDINVVMNNNNQEAWKKLYNNVYSKNKEINTFAVNDDFFKLPPLSEDYEVIEIKQKKSETLIGMVICHKGGDSYNPIIVGLDYAHNQEFKIYRNILWAIVQRSIELKVSQINLGFSAGTEKRKFGAVPTTNCAYIQSKDTFNQTVLNNEKGNLKSKTYAV